MRCGSSRKRREGACGVVWCGAVRGMVRYVVWCGTWCGAVRGVGRYVVWGGTWCGAVHGVVRGVASVMYLGVVCKHTWPL